MKLGKCNGPALALAMLASMVAASVVPAQAQAPGTGRMLRGKITAINGNRLTVRLDHGRTIVVNDTNALQNGHATGIVVNNEIAAAGSFGAGNVFIADSIDHPSGPRLVRGTVVDRTGTRVTVRTDAGRTLIVDILSATETGRVTVRRGERVQASGGFGQDGIFFADDIEQVR